MTFRTATGQTGTAAYTFEAQAIANSQRELDARMARLAAAIAAETADAPLMRPERITGEPDSRSNGYDFTVSHDVTALCRDGFYSTARSAKQLVGRLMATDEHPYRNADSDLD